MKNRYKGGSGRHDIDPDEPRHPPHHHHGGHHRHRSRRGHRLFDYGELRLLILAMIAEHPSHGYELIKLVEERMGGSYSPSPGVIYPTLSWLEDMGYAAVEAEQAGRKRYRITAEGKVFLEANREAVDELLTRASAEGPNGPGGVPDAVVRGMENLKLALRLRLRRGPLDEAATRTIAAALDEAARSVERC